MELPLLLILTVWVNARGVQSALPPNCSYPPSQWCSSLDSAAQCGVLKQCLERDFIRSRQTAEPVEVALYYESLCPGCRLFLVEMLFPSWILASGIMSVALVPYGNAEEKVVGHKYVYQCQHGEQECLGNTIEACVMNMTGPAAFPIIFCMESAADVIKAAESCVGVYSNVSWSSIMSCVKGDLGMQLMHQNALMTAALKPPHEYVPWVTINGEHTDDLQKQAMSNLLGLVCNKYKGTKPDTCVMGQHSQHFRSYCHNN
ncbi:gamma-interferon-inducible lysosomal thiol reductase-like [Myripristis murdjan]|nr:gamma-interferon-inducible lysosomal thiol reductase-like [Myripristis murdjan]